MCDVPHGSHVANDSICNDALFGANALCVYSPQDNPQDCACYDFACDKHNTDEQVICGYELGLFNDEYTRVAASACRGAHYCMDKVLHQCACQSAACDPSLGEEEVSSCTDAGAIQTLQSSEVGTQDTIVSDCRVALGGSSGGGSGGGGTDTNICPGGPGRCRNGDSSTCNCGTSCVQVATCDGCDYECVKGCATDADCKGFFSSSELNDGGSVSPQPLVCIGASSTIPTPHCGVGTSSGG